MIADVQFAPDGTNRALGTHSSPPVGALGGQDLWLIKLDAYGNVVWQRSLGTKSFDNAGALAVLSDGFAVAGDTLVPGGIAMDGLLVRLDGAGNVLWQQTIGDGVPAGALEEFTDVVPWGAGALGAVGRTTNGTPNKSDNVWVVRAGAFGHQTCGSVGACMDKSIAACADGNPCAKPTCEPATGLCKAQVLQPEGSVCAPATCNGTVKTFGSVCSAAGACLPTKPPISCDDKDPCTSDTCNGWDLSCQNAPGYTGACLSGAACVAASCASGSCVATKADRLWTATAATTANHLAVGAVQIGGGALWAVGRTNKPGETYGDTVLQPIGVDGATGDAKTFDLLKLGLDEQPRGALAAGPADTIVVSGSAQNTSKDYQLVLASVTAAGVQWAVAMGGAATESGGALARVPAAMPEGGAGWVMAGGSLSSGAGADLGDAYLVRLDAAGVVKGSQFQGFGGNEHLNAVATVDGTHAYSWGFVAVGHTQTPSAPPNAYLWRTDAKLQTVWEKSPGGPGDDQFHAVAVLRDQAKGQTLICAAGETAQAQGEPKGDGWLACYDGFGVLVWQKMLGGPETDLLLDVVALADGSLLAAGATTGKGFDAWLIKFDANGNVAWQKSYGGNSDETAVAVLALGDGGIALTVRQTVAKTGGSQIQVLRLDAFGNTSCAQSGACMTKAPAACDDGNPCTADTCGPGGACGSAKLADGSGCGSGKVCAAGVCK